MVIEWSVMKKIKYLMLAMMLTALPVMADSSETVNAAIGGAIGGGLGAAVGNEVAGRQGAIIDGAIGAGAGAAISAGNTDSTAADSAACDCCCLW